MSITSPTQVPGYTAGIWDIDAVHSEVGFSVRHMMVSKVRGRFGAFSGTLTTADDVPASAVEATIEMNSIDTNNAQRDGHLRTNDFFSIDEFPTMSYRSTAVRPDGSDYLVDGELTLRGVTKPVVLKLELNGFGPDAYGGTRAGFTGTTQINRKDFGVSLDMPMDGGGAVVGDKIDIHLEVEAVLRQA